MATRRPSLTSRPAKTRPMPPRPSSLSMRYRSFNVEGGFACESSVAGGVRVGSTASVARGDWSSADSATAATFGTGFTWNLTLLAHRSSRRRMLNTEAVLAQGAWCGRAKSAAEVLHIDAVAFDPALHLRPGFPQRLRNRGHISRVLLEKRADLLASLPVDLGQSPGLAIFREAAEPLPRFFRS